MNTNTDTQLINDSLKGNQVALGQLIKKYQNQMYSVCLSILKRPDEAQEAAQDTFIKMHKSLNTFNSGSKFSSWLYKIAYRTSLDYLRKRKKTIDIEEVSFLLENNNDSQEDVMMQSELSQQLLKAIAHLNPDEAGIIRMFYLEEMTIKELAEITGNSISNVKVKLFRGRKKLGEIIKTKFENIESYLTK